jgi:DNA-binding FadR family transcriptional regulator
VLQKVKQRTVRQDIVDQIEQAIIEGRFKPGDRLPSPSELQKMLGTSLGTLREAMRVLEQKGLVETKLGVSGGAYVREGTTGTIRESLGLLILQRKISYRDVAAFRIVIESALLRLVVEKITEKQIAEVRHHLTELKTCADKGADGWVEYLDAEFEMRKLLMRVAGNQMYEVVLVPIHENLFSYRVIGDKADPPSAYRDWCEIVDAIDRRDVTKAIAVMEAHITRYASLIGESLD